MKVKTDTESHFCFVVVLQADPSGPSFQSLFSSTEQMLKVSGGGG